MASLNEIRKKIKTIESTSKITNAMKLVATAKLKKQKEMFANQEIYYKNFYDIFSYISSQEQKFEDSIFFNRKKNGKKTIHITIFSSMGLCGSFNINIAKEIQNLTNEKDEMYVLGKKGKSIIKSKNIKGKIFFELDLNDKEINYDVCYVLASNILKRFLKEEQISNVTLHYTHFVNSLSFIPKSLNLLPLNKELLENRLEKPTDSSIYNLDENVDNSLLEKIMIDYLSTCIYGAILESKVCENASRRNAMDSATKNANELIKSYSLEFNRKRQADITQEITEIVSGSNVGE